MSEVYKIVRGEAPAILKNLFIFQGNIHNIRNFQIIANENKNTVRYDLETIYYRTPYLWTSLPEECKHQNVVGQIWTNLVPNVKIVSLRLNLYLAEAW